MKTLGLDCRWHCCRVVPMTLWVMKVMVLSFLMLMMMVLVVRGEGQMAKQRRYLVASFRDSVRNVMPIMQVETIGDAYMAVANLVKNQAADHAARIARFAIDVVEAANSVPVKVGEQKPAGIRLLPVHLPRCCTSTGITHTMSATSAASNAILLLELLQLMAHVGMD